MAVKNKIPSRDGQYYDTWDEVVNANYAWEKKMDLQKKQNQLLEQQNRLIERQNQLNYQLEQEKIQKNYELEMNKLQHEEKMRILKLFDDIGISKETYDTFINTNFFNKDNLKLMKQRDEHLLMSSKYDYLLHEDENEEKYGYDNYAATMQRYDMYNLKAELQGDECYVKVSKSKQKEKVKLEQELCKSKSWFKTTLISIIPFVLLIICLGKSETKDYIVLISGVLLGVSLLVSKLNMYYIPKQLLEIPDKEFSITKYNSKLEKLIDKEHAAANKITETIKSNNEGLVSKFYDFRINHYNASIEKLLVDVGYKELVESLGIKYQTVNNSNKKHSGTVEDYIEYLETNS